MIAYVVVAALLKPELVGETRAAPLRGHPLGADIAETRRPPSPADDAPIGQMLFSTSLVVLLIVGTLSAIWLGLCTPTEGAGLGAVGALISGADRGNSPARGLAGRARRGPHFRAAAAAFVLRPALFTRAVDDRGFTEAAKRS